MKAALINFGRLNFPVKALISGSELDFSEEEAKTKFEINLFSLRKFVIHSILSPFIINFFGFFELNSSRKVWISLIFDSAFSLDSASAISSTAFQ